MRITKKSATLTGVGLFTLAIIIGCASGSDPEADQGGSSSDSKAKAKTPTKALPGIGKPVKDGDMTFTVKSVTCGKTSIGDVGNGLGAKAQGQYCMVKVKVTNHGKRATTLLGSEQKALDAKGNEYAADDNAWVYLPDSGKAVFEQINPGNAVDGTIIYDVPKGVTITTLELHDSMFSDGVKVRV